MAGKGIVSRFAEMAAMFSVINMDMPAVGGEGRRGRHDTANGVLYFKRGFAPTPASHRHPASALFGSGWRTEGQLRKMRARREAKWKKGFSI